MSEELKNYLGVDWGEARIGLAIGRSDLAMALPLTTVSDLPSLLAVVAEEQIDLIVLGQPLSLSGGPLLSERFKSFRDELEKLSGVEVVLIDERMSSRAADAMGGEKKQRASRDELAAMIILQGYLDMQGRV
jgi:putative holliday junction resolvase